MAKAKPQPRNLPQLRVTLTTDLIEVIDRVAAEIQQPGLHPNRSEALRKIIAEWAAEHPAKKSRKKS